MEPFYIGSGYIEAEQIVYDEFVERLQEERLTSQRSSVNRFTLLMTQCFFDDLYDKLRILRTEVKCRIFEVRKESFNSLLQLFARDFFTAPNRIAVVKHRLPVLAFNLFQWLSGLLQARFSFPRQERHCLTSS